MQHIEYEQKSTGILRLSLNRPQKRNAINAEMLEELSRFFCVKAQAPEVRAILLVGAGEVFCAGADLDYMREQGRVSYEQNMQSAQKLYDLFLSVYLCPVPVVCKMHSAAMGGGLGLAAASDVSVATLDTKMAFSEVHLGLLPAVISPFVCAKMQAGWAQELLTSGRSFTAKEALAGGLVNFIGRELEVNAYLKKLLSSYTAAAPQSVRQTKALTRELNLQSASQDPLKERVCQAIAQKRSSAEARERIGAFFSRIKVDAK